ncbi:MAG: hypothetical protein M0R74_16775 [Dehalococcoidia bacterium]|jgi:hypothetical protein|nr:hypothetical protein [Dehalococcoidia bacterium]
MNDYISAISVLLVFIIMFSDKLETTHYNHTRTIPSKEKHQERDKFEKKIREICTYSIFLLIFETAIFAATLWAVIIGFDGFTPIFLIVIFIIIGILALIIMTIRRIRIMNKEIKLTAK